MGFEFILSLFWIFLKYFFIRFLFIYFYLFLFVNEFNLEIYLLTDSSPLFLIIIGMKIIFTI